MVHIILWINIPMSVLNFAMVSLGLKNQVNMYVEPPSAALTRVIDTLGNDGISSDLLSNSRLAAGAVTTAFFFFVQTSRYAEVIDGNIIGAAVSHEFHSNNTLFLHAVHNGTATAHKLVPGMTTAIQSARIATIK